MTRVCVLISCILLGISGVFGQRTAFRDSLLDEFAGTWVLRGTIAGKQTTHDVSAEWILGHEYLQFREISREKDTAGGPAYEALVTIGWDAPSSQYVCLWLDNTSGAGLNGILAYARREPDRIAFLFKSKDGSLFHTIFVRERKSDSWRWLMDQEENGRTEPFARVAMERR